MRLAGGDDLDERGHDKPDEVCYLIGCEWLAVWAQVVPAHVGSPTPGCGYEVGALLAGFLAGETPAPLPEMLRLAFSPFGVCASAAYPKSGTAQKRFINCQSMHSASEWCC